METNQNSNPKQKVIFATFAENAEQLTHAYFLLESIREFSGRYMDSPVWIYIPEQFAQTADSNSDKFSSLGAEIKASNTPHKALTYYFSGKVYAAGAAEKEAEGKAEILVWMDEDTIILKEPADFELDKDIFFAYRPVMHNRSGSLFSQPPDSFWSRIYRVLSVDEDSLFSMVTPGDRQTIRAYFNAGLLIVRPEKAILRNWSKCFEILYNDPVLAQMCADNIEHRIFLHQTALVGAVLNNIGKESMIELPLNYNYPLFFHQQYEAEGTFDSIEDIITLRYDVYFRNPDPGWSEKLKGSKKMVAWLKSRLGQ